MPGKQKESKHIDDKREKVHDPSFADKRTQDEIDYFGDQQEIALYNKIAAKNKAAKALHEADKVNYPDIPSALASLPGDSDYDVKIRENLQMIAKLERNSRGIGNADSGVPKQEAVMMLENLKLSYNTNSTYNLAKYIADAQIQKSNTDRLKGILESKDLEGLRGAFAR